MIRDELDEPRTKVAAIGLAGENGVKFAGIFSDHGRAAARTGLGALMGSKNLKAIAVRGTGKIPLANQARYQAIRTEANKELFNQNMTAVYRATGTSGAADYLQIVGDMPQKYWTQAAFEGAGKIGGAEMADTILVGTSACQGCVISCGRVVKIQTGTFATPGKVKGPEYETICAFGSQLLIDDLAAITAIGNLCDQLGMDTISAGSAIGLAYYLFDLGILTMKDTGGMHLSWGDPQPCFTLLAQMARREGLGAVMADGTLAFAEHYGVGDLAVQVNGLDVAMHDPRAFSGQTLSYMTSPRGACHNQSDFFSVELGGTIEELGLPMVDPHKDAGKAAFVARHQHWRTVANSLVYCIFAVVPPTVILDLLCEATGHPWTLDELMKAGERAWNLKRIHNLRFGLSPKSEKLPKLLMQSMPDGGQEGHVPDVDLLLREYYAACGWNRETGWPSDEKITELNLDFVQQ
jgi:aldehyde:ferredoxin oxidoreductase